LANGKRKAAESFLSDAFHNWFYAGWVVVDNKWATILPEEIRGTWTPVVTTAEFKRGLEILKRRNSTRQHKRKNFYLLAGLIYLMMPNGSELKLTCTTQKPNRSDGGISYYRDTSINAYFLCYNVDVQISGKLHGVHVADEWLPQIRQVYTNDIERYL